MVSEALWVALAVGATWWLSNREGEAAEPEAPQDLLYLQGLARQAASANRIPEKLFFNLIERESGWDPTVVGITGDVGIAQLNPSYHPRDVAEDPAQALPYAAKYLKQLFDRFGTWEEALAAYNWGPTNLTREGIDNIPQSVQDYVDAILWWRWR